MAESLLAILNAKKTNNGTIKPPQYDAHVPGISRELPFDSAAPKIIQPQHVPDTSGPLNVLDPRKPAPFIAPVPHVLRTMQSTPNRPASIAAALEAFGPAQVDALLGTLFEAEATEGDINASANQAGIVRRLLVVIIMLCSGAGVILNSAPLCQKNDAICLANTAMIASVINAIGLLFLFILEKISMRNNAVRLRDLGSEFSSLSNELRTALYISPPSAHEAQNFVMNIGVRAAELKTRAVSHKVRPQPIRSATRGNHLVRHIV